MAWDAKLVNEINTLINSNPTKQHVFTTPAEQDEYSHAIKYISDIMLDEDNRNDDSIALLKTQLTRFFRIRPNQFNKIPSPVKSVYDLLIKNELLNTEKLTPEEALMTEVLAFIFKNEPQKIDDKDEGKELVVRSSSTIYSTANDPISGIKKLAVTLVSFPWNYTGPRGYTHLHEAAKSGNIELVNQLTAIKDVDLNAVTTASKSTPLFYAIKNEHTAVVATLCPLNGIKVNIKTRLGDDPLTWAMTNIKNNDPLIAVLLAHKDIDFSSVEIYLKKDIYEYAIDNNKYIYITAIESNIGQASKDRVNKYFEDPFRLMKKYNSDELLKLKLKDLGNDVTNNKDINSVTLLHFAAMYGYEKSVEFLLENGADPRIQNSENNTALSLLAGQRDGKKTYPAIAKLLLDAMHADTVNKFIQNGDTALKRAIDAENTDIMRLIIASEKCNLLLSKDSPYNFLHHAARKGWNNYFSCALATPAGIELINSTDYDTYTPLHYAAMFGYVDIVKILLANKADAGIKNRYMHTALSLAAKNQVTKKDTYLSIASILLEHMTADEVNCLCDDDKTALKVAIDNGNNGIVRLICASEKCNLLLKKNSPDNFLHHAAEDGLVNEITLALATHAGKKLINSTDSTRDTPLHNAAINGHVNIVEILLANGANVGMQNNCMNTAFSLAAGRYQSSRKSGHLTIASKLLKLMTDGQVNVLCQDGKTALQWAIGAENTDIMRLIIASEKCNLLLSKDSPYNFLHHAAESDLADLLPCALATPAGKGLINSIDSEKYTPLHLAVLNGYVDIAKMLLANNADVGMLNDSNNTALAVAAGREKDDKNDDYVTIVSMLLERMTVDQVNCLCHDAETALEWAKKKGHTGISKIISDFLKKNNPEKVNERVDVLEKKISDLQEQVSFQSQQISDLMKLVVTLVNQQNTAAPEKLLMLSTSKPVLRKSVSANNLENARNNK